MLKGNRTRLLGLLVILLGALEGVDPALIAAVVPPEYQWLITPAIGCAIIILRELTTTPAGQSDASTS